MKFIAPEVEIKMFNVNDILTASAGAEDDSSAEETTISAFETMMEGECVGNASDNLVPACL